MKGIARSGKVRSSLKWPKKFYESDDVRTLSNNIETKFGLSSICDGLMFIAPEIKADIKLEQAEFQSIVSGEDVSIARKHEKGEEHGLDSTGHPRWQPDSDWSDNAGSILRRILPWNFSRQVKDALIPIHNSIKNWTTNSHLSSKNVSERISITPESTDDKRHLERRSKVFQKETKTRWRRVFQHSSISWRRLRSDMAPTYASLRRSSCPCSNSTARSTTLGNLVSTKTSTHDRSPRETSWSNME